ncbi:MRPL24 (YMR193W) [Zygosaccharomyces parabailii]|nr:MRPL24 (YMR193W) [Zygosaccharomyces parabailii]CDH14315.1 probable 54S ribosomal protein L24,mitochondrial [Zygosaccharomyces bailii ISA1307]
MVSISFKRAFSAAAASLRQWRLVETRRIAQQPQYRVGDTKPLWVPREKKEFPDYKYGESNVFKQSNKGLYGASFLQYGNNVAESKTKTRRRWLPNIVRKGLWSETLDRKISLRMTAKVLRTVSKEGGIDHYLTKDKSARIKELGPTGWKLRYRIMKKKEDAESAPHRDAVTFQVDGKPVTVYYNETVRDAPLKITVGRRRLLKYLYPLEKQEARSKHSDLTYKEFLERFDKLSVREMLERLDQHGFDLGSVSIQV